MIEYVEQRWRLIAWRVATNQLNFEIDLCYNENMEDITIITNAQRQRNVTKKSFGNFSMLLILSRMLLNRIHASPSSATQMRNGKFFSNMVYLGWTNLTKALPLIVNWMFDWRSASGCYLYRRMSIRLLFAWILIDVIDTHGIFALCWRIIGIFCMHRLIL